MEEADKEKHKISLGEVVRTNFKREERQAELVHLILGDNIDPANKITSSRYLPTQEPKGNASPPESTYRLKPPTVTLLPKSTPSSKPSSPVTPTTSERPNSFMDALFKISQSADSPSDDYQLRPQPPKSYLPAAAEIPPVRPFERRQSKNEVRSPRQRPVLKKLGSP
jgi:hypothetical protein